MLCIAVVDMVVTVAEEDISDFLLNANMGHLSTYRLVQKASPGAAIFGRDIMFNIFFLADWKIWI